MSNLFTINSFYNDLCKNVIIEVLFKELYLKGTPNTHYLPKEIPFKKLYCKEGLPVVDHTILNIIKKVTSNQKNIMINKILKTPSFSFLKDEFVETLNRFVALNETDNITDAYKLIFYQYNYDFLSYYKFSG